MGIIRAMVLLCACPTLALAGDISCTGSDPTWDISITGESANFTFGKSVDLTIPQRGSAENRDWPQVLTLLGGSDTAILILHQRQCGTEQVTAWPIEATVLTQRSESPIVLSGCCLPAG